MIHYAQCPVCKTDSIQPLLKAKDYTVSNEIFDIWNCLHCSLLFTQDIPEQINIGKYYQSENYVSHSDTQKGFINKLYHRIRKNTLVSKMKLVKHETGLQTGNILDLGCGTGAFLHTMKINGWRITGLEPDEGARKTANKLYAIQPLPSQQLFELPRHSFDIVTAWHVIEHVHQLHEYLEQMKHLITREGKIIIAVPNYTSWEATHYQATWAAYDVPRHLYHFSPKSMDVLVELHGLKVEKIKPMWYDSFYVSMLSEKYKNGKGNIIKAFFVGLISNAKVLFDKTKCSSVIYVIRKDK